MAIGFFIFLFIRDPFDNYMRKLLFEHSSELIHDKIINYLNLSRKILSLIYSYTYKIKLCLCYVIVFDFINYFYFIDNKNL